VSDEAHWNPVLFFLGGQLHLHLKVGDHIPTWRTYAATSADEGATWSRPAELVTGDQGGRGCVKNKPLILLGAGGEERNAGVRAEEGDGGGDGRGGRKGGAGGGGGGDDDGGQVEGSFPVLLCGASTESESDGWRAFVDISTDGGATFQRTADLEVAGDGDGDGDGGPPGCGAAVIQPSLWRSPTHANTVHMLLRSDAGAVYRADSSDSGRTWAWPGIGTVLHHPRHVGMVKSPNTMAVNNGFLPNESSA
jgi:hypothetical protein